MIRVASSQRLIASGRRGSAGSEKWEPDSGKLRDMEKNCPAYTQQISQQDWEKTPANVKKLLEEMAQCIGQLEQKLVELEAQQQQYLTP